MGAGVGVKEICRVLAGDGNPPLTPERIRQLVNEGMPKAGRNEYDAVRCMFWYLGKVRRMVSHKETENADGSASGIRSERKPLLKGQADREERNLPRLGGEMVTVEDWEKGTADIVAAARARLLGVPAGGAPRALGETSGVLVQGIIEKEIKEALQALGEAK